MFEGHYLKNFAIAGEIRNLVQNLTSLCVHYLKPLYTLSTICWIQLGFHLNQMYTCIWAAAVVDHGDGWEQSKLNQNIPVLN